MILKFSEVLEIKNGKNQKKVENKNGKYPIYGSGGIIGWANEYLCEKENVIIGRKGSINKPIFVDTPFWNVDTAFGLIANREILDSKYLYYFCLSFDFEKLSTTVTIPSLTKNNLLNIKFNVPSLAKQRKIVKKLDKIQEIIKKYQQELIEFEKLSKSIFVKLKLKNKNWDIKSFAEVTKVSQGLQIPISKRKKENGENRFKYITIQFLNGSKEVEYIENPRENVICSKEDILMTRTGNTGMVVTGVSGVFHNNFFIVKYDKNILLKEYLVAYLNSKEVQEEIKKRAGTSTIPDLNHGEFYKIKILIPPITFQEKFSEQIQVIAKSKIEIQKSIEETQKLFDSLMEKYFG